MSNILDSARRLSRQRRGKLQVEDRQDVAPLPKKGGRVANQIRVLRVGKGLSQKMLATLAGASRQTINAVEAGKYAPSLELAFRIARVLDAPLDQVFRLELE